MAIQVTILGSSAALPTPDRFPTAQVVNADERFFLVDCGEGTQVQLKKFRQKPSRINHIFISHLHGDHIFGLFGLISSFSLMGRKNPLYIHTQEAHKEMLDAVFKHSDITFPLEYKFYDPKDVAVIYEDKSLTVTSFPVKHRAPTVGFLFKEKPKPHNIKKQAVEEFNIGVKDIVKIKAGEDYVTEDGNTIKNKYLTTPPPKPHSYAFVTDTLYNEDIIPLLKDVDLLYHEATFSHEMVKIARKTLHATAFQAGQFAKKANAKQLIIGHFSLRYKQLDKLLEEAKIEFPNTIMAFDGRVVKIPSK